MSNRFPIIRGHRPSSPLGECAACGDARPDSDVDLLVTRSEGTSLLDQAALMLELESLLGRKVDIASDGWVKPSIRESLYRDAIAL